MKTEFLAVYDYETGGAWVYLLGRVSEVDLRE
jgi:hypothetical protein